ncbi:MAG TPA: amidohydrolase family protein [Bryobacteraceae bacterium]|nr:amidohydrolase family protein [Bryobacteraceae bacterium]
MRIDAHQHFWDIGRFRYPWMPAGESPLKRNFLPGDLAPILMRNRFYGSVVVQANTVLAETHWLLDLASEHEFIRGVVGWVDLTDPRLGATLDELRKHPKFKGVRHLVHDEPDDEWLVRDDVLGGLRELARRGIPYDLLLRPKHLKLVPRLAANVPELRMVIDHIAKPPIAAQNMDGWAEDMEAAARIPQVFCKLSGMITEDDPRGWKAEHLKPYVAHVLKLFGPDRLMFGSDWPVCTLAGTWKEVLAAFTQAIGPQSITTREMLLGGTAVKFYGL